MKKDRSSFESVIASLIPESVNEFKRKRDEMLEEYLKEDDMTKGLAEVIPSSSPPSYIYSFQLYSDLFLNISCQQYVLDWLEVGYDHIYLYSFDYFNEKSFGPLSYLLPIKGRLLPPLSLLIPPPHPSLFYHPSLGATHCSEIPYILGKGLIWDFTLNEKDIEMVEKVTGAWSNFAKFG